MYGLIHKAVRDCIKKEHGSAAWQRIQERAGLDESAFASMTGYPDDTTLGLITTATNELNADLGELLYTFGRYWVLNTARVEYGPLFEFGGSDMVSFLENLNAMHEQVAITFANLRQPRFTVKPSGPGSLLLHYESSRDGLTTFVLGLIQGLSEHFGVETSVEIIEAKADGAHHDVFRLKIA